MKQKQLEKNNVIGRIISYQRNNDIIAMLLAGKAKQDIIDFICLKYSLTAKTAHHYICQASNIIKDRKRFEIGQLVSIHIDRYEYIYTKLNEIGAWFDANAALKAKEKLLGFHREGFHMKVTQGEIQQVQQQVVLDEYDLKKLTPEQAERFSYLLEKARSAHSLKSK